VVVPQRRIERRFPPYQSGALPLDDCGRGAVWCCLEDSNLPPLAYEASALPDELSQQVKLTKGARRRSLCGSDLVRCAEARRRVQFWTFTMSKSAAPTGTVVMRMRSHGPGRA
jgi:hypothetical protein